jgi:opacity protein-like surface antigen
MRRLFVALTSTVSVLAFTQGGVFGGFAGVQKQWGSWVLGLEAEVDWADITGSTTATTTNSQSILLPPPRGATLTTTETETINSKIDEVGYVGPKVGWAFGPNWMVYVTGGAAWAHKEDTANELLTETCSNGTAVMCIGSPSPEPLANQADYQCLATQSAAVLTINGSSIRVRL